MEIDEILFELIMGAFVIYTSWQIGWKGNTRLIHSYHCRGVSEKDAKIFAKKLGIGGVIVGASVMAVPILNLLLGHEIGDAVCILGTTAGMVEILWTILKYNGRLFRFFRK